jgi:hypothetical protein
MSRTPQRVVIGWTLPSGKQGTLAVDVSINETHTMTSEVTRHQVETGSDIADHIRPIPPQLSIEGMISNWMVTPSSLDHLNGVAGSVQQIDQTIAGQVVRFSAFKFDTQIERVKEVLGDLGEAIQGAALFTIFTTLTSYDNMACVGFTVPRNATLGQVLRFTMDFQFVRTVDTQVVSALPPKTQPKHRGAKGGKEKTGDAKEARKTALRNGVLFVNKATENL